jgi:2-polyprenyl-6-methoxyphenol hydroxylase-like FAD-dependent oxidoreductase
MIHNLSDFEEVEIEEDENDFDIVIVGAGLSGLTAANRLIAAGLNILILEQTSKFRVF